MTENKGVRRIDGAPVVLQVDTHESGDRGSLNRIVGTIYGCIRDGKGEMYWIVEAEVANPDGHEENVGRQRPLTYFLVIPRAEGDSVERAFVDCDDEFPVGIGYFASKPVLGSLDFDPSVTKYFAMGYLSFIRDCHE